MILQNNTWFDNFFLPILVILASGGLLYWIGKVLIRKRLTFSIDYDKSFKSTYKEINYLVLNITIVNKNDFDIKNFTFT